MTGQKQTIVNNVQSISEELVELLDGMDYCLDWRPEESDWSTRQIIYHLLDTPNGGINRVISNILSGDLQEFEIWSNLDNITPERMAHDLQRIIEKISEFFRIMEGAIESAVDGDFENKSTLVHQRTRGTDDQRSVQELLDRAFDGHWRGHLTQIQELRNGLGM